MGVRTGWGGGLCAGAVSAALAASSLGTGGDATVVGDGQTEVVSDAHVEAVAGPGAGSAPFQSGGADALLRGLAGTPPVACELVLRSLGNRWGTSSVTPRVHPPLAPDASGRAVAAWAWSGSPDAGDAAALLAGLEADDVCVRRVAARLLGRVGDTETASRVVDLARTGSGEGRMAAVASLAHLPDARASVTLEGLLDDPDVDVRRAAAWALATAGDEDSVGALAAALRHDDPMLRENAAWALGKIESRAAVEPLASALEDPLAGVRVNAAWALGSIEDASAIPPLADLLTGDAEEEVRRAAAWALGRIEG